MPRIKLDNLRREADNIRSALGEVDHTDTARIRDLLIDLSDVQLGILGLIQEDEDRYDSMRPEER